MMKKSIFVLIFLVSIFSQGKGLKCYHCYDSFTKSSNTSLFSPFDRNNILVRCDQVQSKWNTMNCPEKMPHCLIISGKVVDHYERIRTCAEKNFCSNYVPPNGVSLEYCSECNTTLCNDYLKVPDPPTPPTPPSALFHFNVNINIHIKK